MSWTLALLTAASTLCILFAILIWRRTLQCKHLINELSLSLQHRQDEKQKQENLAQELEMLKNKFESYILNDPITQLPARLVFEDRLEQTIHQSRRHLLTFAVMFIDIDEIKIINNALGFQGGDILLREVAARMRACIRKVDTLCRFANDGFALLLPQLSKAETAAYVAQRLLDELAQPFPVLDQELYVTATIGISIFPNDGEEARTLIKNAETALMQAKVIDRGIFQFYQAEMYVHGRRALLLSSRLRSDTIYQELTIYYQPQVNVKDKKITCMEALLRWQHPDYGLIGPLEFLTLAENNGRIIPIGEWVLRKTCEQLHQWRAQGFDPGSVAVNVSLCQLETPTFVHKVSQILHETNTQPSELIIEISESILLPKFDLVEKTLNMLKYLGVRIAVDDFGSSYVSLQHLRSFSINCLKIDGTLVREMNVNIESTAIAKMIIALANSLSLAVVAEGVETKEQKNCLVELGCVHMQGHLFCHPLLPQEFTGVVLTKLNS